MAAVNKNTTPSLPHLHSANITPTLPPILTNFKYSFLILFANNLTNWTCGVCAINMQTTTGAIGSSLTASPAEVAMTIHPLHCPSCHNSIFFSRLTWSFLYPDHWIGNWWILIGWLLNYYLSDPYQISLPGPQLHLHRHQHCHWWHWQSAVGNQQHCYCHTVRLSGFSSFKFQSHSKPKQGGVSLRSCQHNGLEKLIRTSSAPLVVLISFSRQWRRQEQRDTLPCLGFFAWLWNLKLGKTTQTCSIIIGWLLNYLIKSSTLILIQYLYQVLSGISISGVGNRQSRIGSFGIIVF